MTKLSSDWRKVYSTVCVYQKRKAITNQFSTLRKPEKRKISPKQTKKNVGTEFSEIEKRKTRANK